MNEGSWRDDRIGSTAGTKDGCGEKGSARDRVHPEREGAHDHPDRIAGPSEQRVEHHEHCQGGVAQAHHRVEPSISVSEGDYHKIEEIRAAVYLSVASGGSKSTTHFQYNRGLGGSLMEAWSWETEPEGMI